MSESSINARRWGRAWNATLVTQLGCLSLMIGAPLVVIYFLIACTAYGGSLVSPAAALIQGQITVRAMWAHIPSLSSVALWLFAGWLTFQVVTARIPDILHRVFPRYQGGKQLGAYTPNGERLTYQINGLQAWLISVIAFAACSFLFKLFSPTVICDHWISLMWATTLCGNLVALFVYLKAYLFPTHALDRKFSGSVLYDYYMGVELNPRIRKFDLKLFFNGRPGIVAWTLINISFAAKQYQIHGEVTNSMLLVNFLHLLYVLYFFWKESWYLKTIDMAHDHFGWMLAWGDCTWLPFMYTLQGLYLVYNPVQLSPGYALFILALGLVGFWIFASANNQKDSFRSSNGQTPIWGHEPESLPCSYTTSDGQIRQSKLLLSGWWGIARHFNYTGDLLGSLAYCLACGFGHLLPYFYFIYMVALLVHRASRDEQRCEAKYGEAWKRYCQLVPYRLIPGVF